VIASRFPHLYACLTCSSLHPLLAHHHLCYVDVNCVFYYFVLCYISLWLHFGLFVYIFSLSSWYFFCDVITPSCSHDRENQTFFDLKHICLIFMIFCAGDSHLTLVVLNIKEFVSKCITFLCFFFFKYSNQKQLNFDSNFLCAYAISLKANQFKMNYLWKLQYSNYRFIKFMDT